MVICTFQASWATSSKKQSDKLLEVIRRLAEDDKDGVMANKVLFPSYIKINCSFNQEFMFFFY